jgi:Kef-type K+ transport system membrane component KefB
MNAMTAFIGLLFLAYMGSVVVGGRAVRGYGLPSGSEYLLLGFLLGPYVLGLLNHELLSTLSPFLYVGAGWLLLVSGMDWGYVDDKPSSLLGIALSFLVAVVTGGLVFAAVYWVLGELAPRATQNRLLFAGAIAAVGMETTRLAVRWVIERYGARGPLSSAIALLADADELPALLLVGGLVLLAPMPATHIQLPPAAWFSITLGLGVTLGLISVALMGPELHRGEAQCLMLGAGLLCTGLSTALGLAGVLSSFVLGITLSRTSPHRSALVAIMKKTEQPVLLPVLLLAGALVTLEDRRLLAVLGAALGARLLGKLLTGFILYLTKTGRKAGPLLGLGLLPSGVVTICLAVALSRRIGGRDGDLLLTAAVAMTLLGELLGPVSLRRALHRAGELENPNGTRSEPPTRGESRTESEVSPS